MLKVECERRSYTSALLPAGRGADVHDPVLSPAHVAHLLVQLHRRDEHLPQETLQERPEPEPQHKVPHSGLQVRTRCQEQPRENHLHTCAKIRTTHCTL